VDDLEVCGGIETPLGRAMSIRTIIEVNHDYIDELCEDGTISRKLYLWIMKYHHGPADGNHIQGVRVLGSRHHSETLALKVD
jgi:hypothetical protein